MRRFFDLAATVLYPPAANSAATAEAQRYHEEGTRLMRLAHHSTADTPPSARLDHWNKLTSGLFPGMVVNSANDMVASWRSLRLGETSLCLAKAPRSKITRWETSDAVNPTGRTHFHVQLKGMVHTNQAGNEAVTAAGEMSACSSDVPYALDVSDQNECLVIDCVSSSVPFDPVRDGALASAAGPHMKMLMDFTKSVFTYAANDDEVGLDEERNLEEALHALLKNCLSGLREKDRTPLDGRSIATDRDIYKLSVKFIESHYTDSSLRTSSIAQRLGLPERVIQKSFASMGTSATEFIRVLRLQKAKQRLGNPEFDGSVTDLAMDLGFYDSAHFARKFRAEFGVSPGKFRQRHNTKGKH